MRIPIFQLQDKESYKDEYNKIIKVLSSKCLTYEKNTYSYFEFINEFVFHHWKYRKTYLDCYSYLDHIGINLKNKKINEESFINFLEFILNIQLLIESIKVYKNIKYSTACNSILFHNIPIILDESGYQAYDIDDKVMIFKKDVSYEDIFSIVPDDIYELILSYNSLSNNGIKIKRIILNKIYNYLYENIDKYKNYQNSIFISIKTIVNKMGIIGDIDKKYQNLTNYKLRKYYDYCYSMMCYLIQTESILKYRDEIKGE